MAWKLILTSIPKEKRTALIDYCTEAEAKDPTFHFTVEKKYITITCPSKDIAYKRGVLLHHKFGCYFEVEFDRESTDALKMRLVELRRKYGIDFDYLYLAPYCLEEKCPNFKTETRKVQAEWLAEEGEEVEIVKCRFYGDGCCFMSLDKFEEMLKRRGKDAR
ncbi:MAG: hypothetical protein ACTSV7_13450 [Candidatus Baldrarchaeia archaeon]